MDDARRVRSELTRRGFLGTGTALAAGAYGLYPTLGLAADVPLEFDGSKFQLAAPEPNPKYRRCAAHRHHQPAAAFRPASVWHI